MPPNATQPAYARAVTAPIQPDPNPVATPLSFLPMGGAYKQMPFTETTEEEYAEAVKWLSKVDMSDVYAGNAADAEGEAFCTTDACLMPEHNDE